MPLSNVKIIQMINSIIPLSAFTDNYIWVLVSGNSAIVVDPGDSRPVEKFLTENKLSLSAILITHHHFDHTGGMLDLTVQHNCPVYGPIGDHIEGVTNELSDGQKFNVMDLNFSVIETPGHTLDHISFYSDSMEDPILFCGDTLFSGGCGRLFEGTANQMYASLNKIKRFPENTLIYCAHEYTQSNLSFALEVNPSNQNLVEHSKKVNDLRNRNEITIPTSLGLEKIINPFLRLEDNEIKEKAELFNDVKISSSIETLATIRNWKDSF